jgi:hypothetical protein
MRPRTRLAFAAALAGLVAMALPAGGTVDAAADAHESPIPRGELREVKRATARYHSVRTARAHGFSAFSLDPNNPDVPTCFACPRRREPLAVVTLCVGRRGFEPR